MGVWVGQSFQAQVWLFSSQKTIYSRSLSEEKTEWAWRSCGILSEPKQPPLAAFYPYRRSSRGGLSFSSTVEQNGEPSAFSCRHNIHSQQSRAGEREKDWTGDGDKPGGVRGWWQAKGPSLCSLHLKLFFTVSPHRIISLKNSINTTNTSQTTHSQTHTATDKKEKQWW